MSKRVLMVRWNNMGDVIMALPAAATIRKSAPDTHLAWFIDSGLRELVDDHPWFEAVYTFDRKKYRGHELNPSLWRMYWESLTQGRRFKPDITINLRGHLREAIACRFTGAKENYILQPRGYLAKLIGGKAVKVDKNRHAIERFLDVVEAAGFSPRTYKFHLPIKQDHIDFVDTHVGKGGWITIHVGSGDFRKIWPPERFARVAKALQSEGYEIVLLGGANENWLRDRFCFITRAKDFVGRTSLLQMAEIIKRGRLHLSNASGSAHLAAAFGAPCVRVFGVKPSSVYHPFNQPESVIESKGKMMNIPAEIVTEKCFQRLEETQTKFQIDMLSHSDV